MTVLPNLAQENEALKAKIAALEAAQTSGNRLTPKVSAKGALSLYGMGRFPITLYKAQWERLLQPATISMLNAFIKANVASLKVKGENSEEA